MTDSEEAFYKAGVTPAVVGQGFKSTVDAWKAWQARGELDAVKIKELEASNAYMKELSYVKDGRIKELEEQLDIKQTMPMKYKRMAFNAQLQKENDELTAKLDKAREALNSCLGGDDYYNRPIIEKALQELDK